MRKYKLGLFLYAFNRVWPCHLPPNSRVLLNKFHSHNDVRLTWNF